MVMVLGMEYTQFWIGILFGSSWTSAGVINEANITPTGEDIARIVVAITRWTPENQFWLT